MCPHAGGFLIGMAFGIGTRYVLRWMRHLGAGIEQQVALTFALGYLSFYTANGPAGVSGGAPNYLPWFRVAAKRLLHEREAPSH